VTGKREHGTRVATRGGGRNREELIGRGREKWGGGTDRTKGECLYVEGRNRTEEEEGNIVKNIGAVRAVPCTPTALQYEIYHSYSIVEGATTTTGDHNYMHRK
jgi:hypothetical protein